METMWSSGIQTGGPSALTQADRQNFAKKHRAPITSLRIIYPLIRRRITTYWRLLGSTM